MITEFHSRAVLEAAPVTTFEAVCCGALSAVAITLTDPAGLRLTVKVTSKPNEAVATRELSAVNTNVVPEPVTVQPVAVTVPVAAVGRVRVS